MKSCLTPRKVLTAEKTRFSLYMFQEEKKTLSSKDILRVVVPLNSEVCSNPCQKSKMDMFS